MDPRENLDDASEASEEEEPTAPRQLYRSKDASLQRTVLELLLEREDLTQQDVIDYCQGRPV